MRIVWTAPALRDLRAARASIARDKPDAADRQVARILRAVENLTRFPELGRPGRRAGTRELVVGNRLANKTVEILRVLHGRQRWPDGF